MEPLIWRSPRRAFATYKAEKAPLFADFPAWATFSSSTTALWVRDQFAHPLSHSVPLRAKSLPSPPPLKKQSICASLQSDWVLLKLHPLPSMRIAPLPSLSKENRFRNRSKHIALRWSFVSERQQPSVGDIQVISVSRKIMLADISLPLLSPPPPSSLFGILCWAAPLESLLWTRGTPLLQTTMPHQLSSPLLHSHS